MLVITISNIFTDRRYFQIFILGAFSGMPLTILFSTLFAWLKDANIDIEIITTFAIARSFYSLKVLWAPIVDHITLPFIGFLGVRRSWMVLCATLISIILYAYSLFDPNESISVIYWLTVAMGVASATFDVAFDAFRIEKLEPEMQSIGAANTVLGYRIGMLIAGAGAFWGADTYGWSLTFQALCGIYAAGVIFIIFLTEPVLAREKIKGFCYETWKIMAINPFTNFFERDYALLILLAVIFYKLGDAMLGVVATPFYLELGFSKSEIASVVKVFGLGATIVGSYIGGYLMFKKGNLRGLLIAGVAQSITNLAFVWLNHKGYDIVALMTAISIENIASGMGNAALVGYLSNLCNRRYSASQYALLSSASGLFSHTITMYGGTLLSKTGWDGYFIITIFLALPGLALLVMLDKKIRRNTQQKTIASE